MDKKFLTDVVKKAVNALPLRLAPNNSKTRLKKNNFGRAHRLTKKTDFSKLRKTASKLVSRHWVLFYSSNENGLSRLAVTVSAKYGNSVNRNFFKRWLRENFRINKHHFKNKDLHFVAKQKAASLDKKRYKDELNEDFQKLLHRFA